MDRHLVLHDKFYTMAWWKAKPFHLEISAAPVLAATRFFTLVSLAMAEEAGYKEAFGAAAWHRISG